MRLFHHPSHPSSSNSATASQNIVTSAAMLDVWISEIGPKLRAPDLFVLSKVSRWGHKIAHSVQTHQGYAIMALRKKATSSDLQACQHIERVWPNIKLGIYLEDWTNQKVPNSNTHDITSSTNTSSTSSGTSSTTSNRLSLSALLSPRFSSSSNKENNNTTPLAAISAALGSASLALHVQSSPRKEPLCRPSALTLHRCHLSDFEFVDATRLEKLVLRATRLSGIARLSLVQCLREASSSLSTLEISGGWLGTEGIKDLASVVCSMPRLTALTLAFHELGPEDISYLIPALERMSHITSLSIFGNQLGSAGAEHLSRVLCHMTQMRSLDLRQNKFGVDGAKHLASALCAMALLTSLNLCNNEFGSEGAMCLAPALHRMTQISTLNLAFNDIDSTTKEYLCKSLEHLPHQTSM